MWYIRVLVQEEDIPSSLKDGMACYESNAREDMLEGRAEGQTRKASKASSCPWLIVSEVRGTMVNGHTDDDNSRHYCCCGLVGQREGLPGMEAVTVVYIWVGRGSPEPVSRERVSILARENPCVYDIRCSITVSMGVSSGQ